MAGAMDLTGEIASTSRFAANLPTLPSGGRMGGSGNVAAAHKSAEDFASFFLSQSLESMYADVSADKLFGGGNGEEVYRSLLLQEYGKVAAQSGSGRNLVDAVQRQILLLQEKAREPAT